MSIKQFVSDLLTKADSTSKSYLVALEEKDALYLQIQLQLKEEVEKETELHKMALLKQIENSVYKEQQEVVTTLQAKLAHTQKEIHLISAYKSSDVDEILVKIAEVKPEFNRKYQEEVKQVQLEIAEAKKEYLEKLSVLGKQYDVAVSDESRLQKFLTEFGKQKNMYLPYKSELLAGHGTVSQDEANRAL